MIETPAQIITHAAGAEAADSFVAWRKRIKKPLTETAALRIAKTLAAINAAGGNASDALGMAEEHGWMTIKADWYFRKMTDGNRIANGATGANPNATDEQIHVAARFDRTPHRDCF